MNVLSRLLGRTEEARPLASVSPGELWIVRDAASPKGPKELIFQRAELSLNSTTRKDVVTLEVADLNNEKDDDDDAGLADEDREYLVHPDLKLGYSEADKRVVIVWRDLETDGDRFEFVCGPEVTPKSLDAFDTLASKSLYMQTHDTLPPAAEEEKEFADLLINYSEKSRPSAPFGAFEKSDGEEVYTGKCDLCFYNSSSGRFVRSPDLQGVDAVIVKTGPFAHVLELVSKDAVVLAANDMNVLEPSIDTASNSLLFNAETKTGFNTYLLQFENAEKVNAFDEALSIAIYESVKRAKWGALNQPDQKYLLDAMRDMTMTDVCDVDGDDRNDEEDDRDDRDDEEEDDDGRFIDDSEESKQFSKSSELNSALETGHVNDRSYVVRGRRIGVFSNARDGLKYSTTIENIDFDPKNIMLHESDRALMIQNKDDPSSLYRMDLETGKIVDEWNTHKRINAINPVNKYAQTTDETTMLGAARSSLFRLDPRLSAGIVDVKNEKIYSSNLGFTKIASTADGFFAVGDEKGNIRLFDEIGKVAKMQIQGLGDPIIGLDVTADGSYVLATCDRYLLLIEARTSEMNGFNQRWPKESRPKPRKLTISPTNANYMRQQTNKPILFTPARFNAGINAKEVSIITSTGPYLVSWNLQKVLSNSTNQYTIKQYGSEITAENFEFGTDKRVIVTLTDDVEMVSNTALKNPSQVFRRK